MYLLYFGSTQLVLSISEVRVRDSMKDLDMAKKSLEKRKDDLKQKKDRISQIESIITNLQNGRKTSGG